MTTSLCPICYATIPASISKDVDAVWMDKRCPVHGRFIGLVEKSAAFYDMAKTLPNSSIYDGLLVDITDTCNLACKTCLHDNKGGHYSVESVIEHCMSNKDKGPFFLSGGEPTLHPQMFEIISALQLIGGVGVITNGIKLLGVEYLAELCKVLGGETVPIAFSIHPQIGINQQVIDNFRTIGKKLSSAFWVITDLSEIPLIVDFFEANSDVIKQIRVKAATNVWKTQGTNKMFVSDMLTSLKYLGDVEINELVGNKTTALNVKLNGLDYMLVSWYDKHNIDLEDIDCPPYYMGKDGVVRDFLTASILNERLA